MAGKGGGGGKGARASRKAARGGDIFMFCLNTHQHFPFCHIIPITPTPYNGGDKTNHGVGDHNCSCCCG